MRIQYIISLVFLLFLSTFFCWGRSFLNVNESNFLITPNSKYVIKSTIDLHGRTINAPKGCLLVFQGGGKIVNGTIVGKETKLKSLKNKCLGINIKGTWNVNEIHDSFFDFELLTDNQVLDNITCLQSNDKKNKVLLNRPVYSITLTPKHKSALLLSSNTILLCNSTFQLKGNNLSSYYILGVVKKENVTIKGGRIIGDVGDHHYVEGSTSEWGFGLMISNSNNVRIEDIHISKCTGDGIYIGGGSGTELEDYSKASKNIYVKNTVCDDNRRQGISITYADGIVLDDCTFSNTGKTEFTSPGCGLDIEPNAGQGVRNVRIKRCRFLHYDRIMVVSVGGYKTEDHKCNVENIYFEDCETTGKMSIRTGSVSLRNCSLKTLEIYLGKMPKEKVLVERCHILDGAGITIRTVGDVSGEKFRPVYTFRDCTIGMNQERTNALFSTINYNGKENVEFNIENCSVVLPKGKKLFSIVPSKSKMSFQFRNCIFHTKNSTFDLNNKFFSNCQLIPND